MIKIVVDGFGGDRSPMANVEGTVKALNENNDLQIILTGDEEILNQELAKYNYDKTRLEIVHAPDVISCEDKPTEAIKQKKESSLVKAYDLLKQEDDVKGLVSIGSTGAVLVGSVLKIGRVKGVKRPNRSEYDGRHERGLEERERDVTETLPCCGTVYSSRIFEITRNGLKGTKGNDHHEREAEPCVRRQVGGEGREEFVVPFDAAQAE